MAYSLFRSTAIGGGGSTTTHHLRTFPPVREKFQKLCRKSLKTHRFSLAFNIKLIKHFIKFKSHRLCNVLLVMGAQEISHWHWKFWGGGYRYFPRLPTAVHESWWKIRPLYKRSWLRPWILSSTFTCISQCYLLERYICRRMPILRPQRSQFPKATSVDLMSRVYITSGRMHGPKRQRWRPEWPKTMVWWLRKGL